MRRILYCFLWMIFAVLFFVMSAAFFRLKFQGSSLGWHFEVNERMQAAQAPTATGSVIKFEFRDNADLKTWEEKVFSGHTLYEVIASEDGEGTAVHAISEGVSSALFQKVGLRVESKPVFQWQWKVLEHPVKPEGESLTSKKVNDFGMRVYAIFNGRIPLLYDVVQYAWDEQNPAGTSDASPFSKRVQVMVLRGSETELDGKWLQEKRNVVEDYRALFGRKPAGELVVIGFMADSDNTGSRAEGMIRALRVESSASFPGTVQVADGDAESTGGEDSQASMITRLKRSFSRWFSLGEETDEQETTSSGPQK